MPAYTRGGSECADSHLNQQRVESHQEFRVCGINFYILLNFFSSFMQALTRNID